MNTLANGSDALISWSYCNYVFYSFLGAVYSTVISRVFPDPGATRTENARELTFARQSVVVHAKAYGFQAIDMVYINFKGMSVCLSKRPSPPICSMMMAMVAVVVVVVLMIMMMVMTVVR